MKGLTPSELILARVEALREADYGSVFDSYHSASMFRQQFQERDEYIRFGWAHLGKNFRIRQCRILQSDPSPPQARVIFHVEMDVAGEPRAYVEMASLQQEGGQWRYLCGQKIEAAELPCPLEQVDFETFDRIEQKVIF